MATKQIKDYSAKTALESTDQLIIQEAGDTTKKTTVAELGTVDGWIPAGETWTYASADDPTYTFTITGDYTTKYSVGMKLRLTQTTVKYFIITAVSYSDPDTTITVYGGTDYDLTSAAITLPYYSMVKAPFGFPMDTRKWSETFAATPNAYKTSPSANTYYGGANAWTSGDNITLILPIGQWIGFVETTFSSAKTSEKFSVNCLLSTSNNSSSSSLIYKTFSCYVYGRHRIRSNISSSVISTKTTYYLLLMTSTAVTDEIRLEDYYYKLTCAYL